MSPSAGCRVNPEAKTRPPPSATGGGGSGGGDGGGVRVNPGPGPVAGCFSRRQLLQMLEDGLALLSDTLGYVSYYNV